MLYPVELWAPRNIFFVDTCRKLLAIQVAFVSHLTTTNERPFAVHSPTLMVAIQKYHFENSLVDVSNEFLLLHNIRNSPLPCQYFQDVTFEATIHTHYLTTMFFVFPSTSTPFRFTRSAEIF